MVYKHYMEFFNKGKELNINFILSLIGILWR